MSFEKSSADNSKILKKKDEMNHEDKLINHKIIMNMNKRIKFLRNPRFKTNNAPLGFADINNKPEALDASLIKICPFRTEPSQIIFRDYMINNLYLIKLKVINVSPTLARIKFLPPSRPEFSLGKLEFPAEVDGNIAPGMSLTIPV